MRSRRREEERDCLSRSGGMITRDLLDDSMSNYFD